MQPHELTREQARRIAVRAQWLDLPRPTDLHDLVRRLTLLQIDPVSAIAPSADLVAWSRLGSSYRPEHLQAALRDHSLLELRAMIRPAEDFVLYRGEMAARLSGGPLANWQEGQRSWVAKNDSFRRDILDRLENDGPLPSRDLPDTCVVPWASTGWTNEKNVTRMLEILELTGEVAITGRQGRERLWDLGSRVHPDEPPLPVQEALAQRNERRLHALGLVRSSAPAAPIEPLTVGEVGEPAVVEGVRGTWRVDPAYLGPDLEEFSGRAALLSPFDRLLHDRKRTLDVFEFEYQLEMYKPVAKRRWGYYALPILFGDRLVGKLDAKADRKEGVLHVYAVHQDVRFTRAMTKGVDAEIADLANWLGLEERREG